MTGYDKGKWLVAKCRKCGKSGDNFKGTFYKQFEQTSIFRGDDVEVDCLCEDCGEEKK